MTVQISPTKLKAQLVSFARQIGFDSCRIAACTVPAHATEFREWLREGAHGEMNYMERGEEKRCDPQQVLPGGRSIVVLALNYFQGEQVPRRSKTDARGPILERDHAAQAGIGWHGKNTMLIDEQLGTWFFLAEILTTLDLPPDAPVPDRCGTCERCIKACPTGAITAPHRLDARRCISYLTIELKGSIPLELRPLIGDRIFGCDDCLAVCPWNRFAQVSHETAFSASQSTTGMSLREYLELTDAEFRSLFKNSPIKRIKRRGFLRNVCVALGNAGDASDIPALERAATDPEPLIAEHARWAIHQIRARRETGRSD